MSKKPKTKFKKLDLDFSHKPASEPWADIEVEKDQGDQYDLSQIQQLRQSLPSAPRAIRAQHDVERIPTHGPFKAYVGNIPFDATEDDLTRFFRGLTVTSVKFVTAQNKMRGFGYVEFDTRDDLISALQMSDSNFQNRKLKIDLAESNEKHGENDGMNRGERSRGDRGNFSNRQAGAAESDNNWRSGGGPPPRADNDRFGDRQKPQDDNDRFSRGRGGFERRDDRRDADRDYNNSRNNDRRDDFRGGGSSGFSRRSDDRSDNWRRDGPPPRRDDDSNRGRNDEGYRGRNDDSNRGRNDDGFRGRNDEGNRGRNDDGFRGRNDEGYRGRNDDSNRGRNDEGNRGRNDDSSWRRRENPNNGDENTDCGHQKRPDDATPSEDREQPRERQRLQLAPRTKPLEEKAENPSNTANRQSSIFGDAKPVDTLRKELEIENKLEKEKEEIMHKVDTNQSSNNSRGSNPPSNNPPRQTSVVSPNSGVSSRSHLDSHNSSSSSQGRQRLSSGGVAPPSRDRRISDNSSSVTEDSYINNNQNNATTTVTTNANKKEPSEDQEAVKLIPAPLPTVNIWNKRKEQSHGDGVKAPNVPPGTNNNTNSSSQQSRPHPEAQASVSAKPPPQKVATVSVAKVFQPTVEVGNAWARGPPKGTAVSESNDSANSDHSQVSNPPTNAWTHGDSSRIK